MLNTANKLDGFHNNRGNTNAGDCVDVGADIFHRGLCLPSDNKMIAEEQTVIIDIIRRRFERGT